MPLWLTKTTMLGHEKELKKKKSRLSGRILLKTYLNFKTLVRLAPSMHREIKETNCIRDNLNQIV